MEMLYLLSYPSNLERAMGIEPTYRAWKALILPLNYARSKTGRRPMHDGSQSMMHEKYRKMIIAFS